MNNVSDRLSNVTQIREYISELERIGLWKSTNIADQATIEDTKDEILRILNLIETELERSGLWDRPIDIENKSSDSDSKHSIAQTLTLDQIAERTQEAIKCISGNINK